MPNFDLAPVQDDSAFEPVVLPPEPPRRKQWKPATQGQMNQRLESAAGPLKPLVQLGNVLASPDTKTGIFVGPVNAISKLTNALGDWVQRKPIDTRDAWVIPEKAARQLSPFRLFSGQEVTPADKAGMQVGGAIGAEIVGAATGATVLRRLAQVAQVKRAADALKASRAARALAVAQKFNPVARSGAAAAGRVGEALVGATLAAPFLDQDGGNLANLVDNLVVDPSDTKGVPFVRGVRPGETGIRLPGRADEADNYLTKVGKSIAVEGIAAPLALMGAAALIPPLRKWATTGAPEWLDELANAELERYTGPLRDPLLPGQRQPLLPSVQAQAARGGGPIEPVRVSVDEAPSGLPGTPPGLPQLPTYEPRGGALAPHGSAIERALDEATMVRQVEEQRNRLLSSGLIRQGEAGQLELAISTGDDAARAQIEQLQRQRGELLAQAQGGGDAQALLGQVDEIDRQIADLNMSGDSEELLAPRGSRQGELNLDTRPEIDTYLAQLDELSDAQLRQVHGNVIREAGAARDAADLEATKQRVQELQQRVADINSRREAGTLTPRGARGLLTRAQREMSEAQAQLLATRQRMSSPETTVGQQLDMALTWQPGLDLAPEVSLPPLREIAQPAEAFGYRGPDDYRAALQGWHRDKLRALAQPSTNPEVAALVKARTGRRVWAAKKADIVDALVELGQRQGRYLPPDPEQLPLDLRTNLAGQSDAPLLDVPLDPTAVAPPVAEYRPRGLDPQAREQMKAEILRRAIDNGEVQAPVTPIPDRPTTSEAFNQGAFIDDLFADETGQALLAFNYDELTPYRAGGKNADALIEEMRLRFEFSVLDAKGQQAAKDAWMAAHGWDSLSWEEKKRLGLMGRGVFAMPGDELAAPVDMLRPPTPQFNPELPGGAAAPRDARPYRGDGSAMADATQQFTPELAPKPDRKPQVYDTKSVYQSVNGEPAVVANPSAAQSSAPTGKGKQRGAQQPSASSPRRPSAKAKEAQDMLTDLRRDNAAIKQRLEELRKQHQGGSC